MSQPIQEPTIGLGEDIEAFGYKQELRRGLQLHDVVLYGVLFMVLIAPQSIWGSLQVDSGGLTPLVYIIGFVAISFTALSYAAMSSKFPIAGSARCIPSTRPPGWPLSSWARSRWSSL